MRNDDLEVGCPRRSVDGCPGARTRGFDSMTEQTPDRGARAPARYRPPDELVLPTAEGRSNFEELRRRKLLQRQRMIAEATRAAGRPCSSFSTCSSSTARTCARCSYASDGECCISTSAPAAQSGSSSTSTHTAKQSSMRSLAGSRRHRRQARRRTLPRWPTAELDQSPEQELLTARGRQVAPRVSCSSSEFLLRSIQRSTRRTY